MLLSPRTRTLPDAIRRPPGALSLRPRRRVRSRLALPALPLLFVPRNTSVMLASDCRLADILLQTSKGKVDFHALRTTAINLLFAQGATPPEAQALARHSTPALTVGVYGRAHDSRLVALVEDIGMAILPVSQRAPRVHAQVVGAPLTQQLHEETTAQEQPIMPLRLALIKTDSGSELFAPCLPVGGIVDLPK
jgi:hypothetical protein